jgi:hypothetical protein
MSDFPKIKDTIQCACHTLTPVPTLIAVPVAPEADCKPNHCFDNVADKVMRCGGKEQFGYSFCANERMVVATHHVIWRSPTGELRDITPVRHICEREQVLGLTQMEAVMEDGNLLFLPDDSATLLLPGWPRPCKAFALSKNPEAQKAVRRLNAREWRYWSAVQRGAFQEAIANKPGWKTLYTLDTR